MYEISQGCSLWSRESERQGLGPEVVNFLLLRHLIHPEQLCLRHSTCRGCFPSSPVTPSSLDMGGGEGTKAADCCYDFWLLFGDQRVWETERGSRIF